MFIISYRLLKVSSEVIVTLSHLLIAGCHIGVQLSCCPSICHSVRQLLSMVNFYVPMIARIIKSYLVIVLDLLYEHAPIPGALDLHFMLHCRKLTSSKILKCVSLYLCYETLLSYCPLQNSTSTHLDPVPLMDMSRSIDLRIFRPVNKY